MKQFEIDKLRNEAQLNAEEVLIYEAGYDENGELQINISEARFWTDPLYGYGYLDEIEDKKRYMEGVPVIEGAAWKTEQNSVSVWYYDLNAKYKNAIKAIIDYLNNRKHEDIEEASILNTFVREVEMELPFEKGAADEY